MKKKPILYCLAIATILFLVYKINVGLALGLDTFLINLLPQKEVPSEFVNYKKISEIKKFRNHTITLFNEDKSYSQNSYCQILVISREKIILKFITKIEKYDHGGGNIGNNYFNTVFKMDSFGSILDTINYKTSSSDQSDFGSNMLLNKQIVNKDLLYYQTWPTDGNKTKKDFIPVNKDLTWNAEKISKYYYDTIVRNCVYLENFYVWRDKSIPVNKRSSIIYFINNKWYILYGVDPDISSDIQVQNSKHSKKIIEENAFDEIPDNRVLLKYFQKLKYNSSLAGQTQSNSPYTYYYWDGIAYINILFAKDTLKLKCNDVYLKDYDTQEKSVHHTKEENQKEMQKRLKSEYGFYTNPNLEFTLIYNKDNLYLIKKTK